MLKTKFLKKEGRLSSEEKFLTYFFSHYREWQIAGDKLQGSTGYSESYSGSYKTISVTSKRLLKTKFFEKKSTFLVKKRFWRNFSRIIESEKTQWTVFEGPIGNLTLTVEVIRSFHKDLRGWWIHKFLNKRQSFQWRKFCGVLSLALSSVTNLRWQPIRVQRVVWQ